MPCLPSMHRLMAPTKAKTGEESGPSGQDSKSRPNSTFTHKRPSFCSSVQYCSLLVQFSFPSLLTHLPSPEWHQEIFLPFHSLPTYWYSQAPLRSLEIYKRDSPSRDPKTTCPLHPAMRISKCLSPWRIYSGAKLSNPHIGSVSNTTTASLQGVKDPKWITLRRWSPTSAAVWLRTRLQINGSVLTAPKSLTAEQQMVSPQGSKFTGYIW